MAIPIPKRPSGYRQGHCHAPIQVDVFVDIECPFSKKAWTTLLSVAKHYGEEQVSLVVHPVVLAGHRQSWDVTKTAVLLAAGNPAKFWDIFTYLYDRQEKFAKDAFNQQTHVDLYNLLARFTADFGWSDGNAFIQQLMSKEIEQETKISIRYAISQGVWSTPTYLLNGGEASKLSSSSTLSDWQAVLDSLLA